MENNTNETCFNGVSLIRSYDPKKADGLIQIPENAPLKEVIELLNDINLTITANEELAKKWKKWMPNGK